MFPRNMFCILVLTLILFAVQEAASEVNIVIDGDFADWEDVPVLIEDPDDIAEDNGDIKEIRVHSSEDTFYAMLTVYGTAAPKDARNWAMTYRTSRTRRRRSMAVPSSAI